MNPPADEPKCASRLSALLGGARELLRTHRLLLALTGLALVALTCGSYALASTRALPLFDTLKDYRPLIATRVYGIDGQEAFAFYRERRTVVPFDRIPEVVKKAVLASEDAHFYEHGGVNYFAIARCAVKGLFRGRVACGGSTITQQVVKTFLLAKEWRVKRKLKELFLAPRLEEHLSKDEILYLYLNQIYFGHRRYGVEEAARFYFDKGVASLSVGEAAMLAGLVQSPERLSPVKHPKAAKERQRYVLRRMAEEGFISQRVADAEAAKPIVVANHPAEPSGSWYADAVRRYLDERYGAERVETDGLVVEVGLDTGLERAAEEALQAQLRAVDKRQGWRGPVAHLDPDQLSRALPVWRERLRSEQARSPEPLAWDLGHVAPDDVDPTAEDETDVRRMLTLKPLAAGGLYDALVSEVSDRAATVDLGGGEGTIALAEVQWARKYNPTSATAAPRRMKDVVKAGDVVLVRILPGKASPSDLARAHKPVPLALEQVPRVQGALVAVDAVTREVRALVGGYQFGLSQFNRAIQARRQPGSAFKPFVWGAAIASRRYTPATLVYDTPDLYRDPYTGKEWKPQNFERDEYDGPLLLKQALAFSKNTVSVKLTDALGVDAVIDFARRCGVEGELPRTLSLALGVGEVSPLELVNAYASIAAGGFSTPPLLVLRVKDRNGDVLEEHPPVLPPADPASAATEEPAPDAALAPAPPAAPAGEAVLLPAPAVPGAALPAGAATPEASVEPGVAYVLTSMMRDVVEYGTGAAAASLGRPLAGKTGTAQDHRDAWFVGFSPDLVAGVWVGFDSHEPLGPHETGAGAALPAWMAFMREALARRPPEDFRVARGVEFARIDAKTGLLATEGDGAASLAAFLSGTAPSRRVGEEVPGLAPQSFFMDDH